MARASSALALVALLARCAAQDSQPVVGPTSDGATIVTTAQLIRPAGPTIEIAGRPVDLALTPDGATLLVKDNRGLVVIDAQAWTLKQELPLEKDGGSMLGIAVTRDGRRAYLTTAKNTLAEATRADDGKWKWSRRIELPGPDGKGAAYPCGVALSADDQTAYVCLSRNNTLGVIELATGKLAGQIEVGVAPYAVAINSKLDELYVSNWGGRRPRADEKTADSSGTPALIDERGIASSGTVSIIDVRSARELTQVAVGLSPSALHVDPADGRLLYVACANSDTIEVIDLAARKILQTLSTRPLDGLPFGSMPNGISVTERIYVSNAGNNAVAVLDRPSRGDPDSPPHAPPDRPRGSIPTGWYPGGVIATERHLFVANVKGVGSRSPRPNRSGWNSHGHRGSITRIDLPDDAKLAQLTRRAQDDARVPQTLAALQRDVARRDAKPTPVPAQLGEPSVFEHVFYVIKENRTYDQVFGDIPRGNRDARLCIYGAGVTPNHHALAEEFVLLDNFYCNGVLSADGHSWATEGNVTPYLERSFGGFGRSYTFGDDPLTYSSSGFVWDHVLAGGYSWRNYGEFDQPDLVPGGSYAEVFADWQNKGGKFAYPRKIGVQRVLRYSCPDYPGWNMNIPDQLRADVFLKELDEFNRNGQLPNFITIYLPNDHTSGTAAGAPTPRSLVADNDLALGRIVSAISKSAYWSKSVIFVIEDDPQDGFDHVDGHRSLCLVISPYARRGALVSNFYNQTSVIHTIERIFGLPPQNQLYALAPLMSDCFADAADARPYETRENTVPLCELNPQTSSLPPRERHLAELSAALPLAKPDQADEDTLNRILWHAARGADAPYPAEWAGAHGRGLPALGLKLAGGVALDEDDRD